MKLLLLAALLQGGTECPASLMLHQRDPVIAHAAQAYADCLTRPMLPAAHELPAATARCAGIRSEQLGRTRAHTARSLRYRSVGAREDAARDPFDWIDHVTANLDGCETRILVGDRARRGN